MKINFISLTASTMLSNVPISNIFSAIENAQEEKVVKDPQSPVVTPV